MAVAHIREQLGYSATSLDHTDESKLGSMQTKTTTEQQEKNNINACVYILIPYMLLFSDIYVFGVGGKVNKEQLNSLASKKRDEQHVFVLKTYGELKEVFNSIISK